MPDQQLDAIIFVSGLGEWADQSADSIARRIAVSLDRNAQTVQAQFNLKLESRDEEYVSSAQLTRKTQVRTIFRKDGAAEVPVLDIYALDYRPTLSQKYERQNVLVQSARLFLLLVINLPRFVRASFSPAKGRTAKAQFYFALLILSLLTVYMAVLFAAAAGVVGQALWQSSQAVSAVVSGQPAPAPAATPVVTPTPAPAPPPGAASPQSFRLSQLLGPLQTLVVLVAALQALWPGLREGLVKGALTYISLIEYITYGERREVIAGQFSDLLEHIAEKGAYRHIHFVAFSFGSIVTLDTLFPANRKPGERFRLVHTLVTIGCPFDFLRMFWPEYFRKRQTWPDRPQRWINLYSPVDALASNFRDNDEDKPAERGIALADGGERKPDNLVYSRGPDHISPLAALALAGLRAHTTYWEVEYESEVSCFTDIVLTMYTGDPLLQ
jgi:hypothetical protein